jgi:hypothetical protein
MGDRKNSCQFGAKSDRDQVLDESIIIQEVLGRTNPLLSSDVTRTA